MASFPVSETPFASTDLPSFGYIMFYGLGRMGTIEDDVLLFVFVFISIFFITKKRFRVKMWPKTKKRLVLGFESGLL